MICLWLYIFSTLHLIAPNFRYTVSFSLWRYLWGVIYIFTALLLSWYIFSSYYYCSFFLCIIISMYHCIYVSFVIYLSTVLTVFCQLLRPAWCLTHPVLEAQEVHHGPYLTLPFWNNVLGMANKSELFIKLGTIKTKKKIYHQQTI